MKAGLFLKIMATLIFFALVANLVVALNDEDGGWVGRAALPWIAFFSLAAANFFLCGAGIHFTQRAHEKHGKSSIQWGRRAFVVNTVIAGLFTLAPWLFFEDEVLVEDAMFNMSLVLLLFGLSTGTFLFSFYREFVRSVGSRPKSSRPRRPTPGPREGGDL